MENKNLIIFIIIALVIVAAVYFMAFWDQPLDEQSEQLEQLDDTASDTAIIEEDLMKTDIEALDGEFADIDAELEAALGESQ